MTTAEPSSLRPGQIWVQFSSGQVHNMVMVTAVSPRNNCSWRALMWEGNVSPSHTDYWCGAHVGSWCAAGWELLSDNV